MRKMTKRWSRLVFAFIGLTLLVFACGTLPGTDADVFSMQGTVVYQNVEGGVFVIISDDGRVYDPVNLEDSFKQNGLKVNIKARYQKDVMSSRMVGTIIEIIDIAVQ